MDQKKRHLIKTLINVLPIFIVPLVTERKHIKNHSEVKKVTAATSRASKTVANKATDVKEFVIDKKQEHDNKRELKKIAKENDPDETEKKGEKLAKDNKHDIKKLAKKLQKNIEQRHHDEEKNRDKNKKARIKEIKKYEEHDAQSVTKQNNKETHHES